MKTSAPKRKRPGSKYCCVVGCHNSVANTKGKEPIVRFYSFSGKWYEPDRREAWIRTVRRKNSDGSPWLLQKKKTRICSRHFVNNAKSESQANPAYLPTLFPDVYKKRRVSGERHDRWARNLTSPHPPEEFSPVDVLSNASEADRSPDANAQSKALEQGSLLLTEETQTDPVCCKGPLQLMLSATDGTHGSTQVTHVAQADKTWASRCGFLGYESVKSSEQALQDLCSVTVTVFSMLLNLLPEQWYRSSDVTKEDRLVLFLMKLKLGVSLTAQGAIFGISKSTASRVFRVTLDLLHREHMFHE
ncbi:uncharacterized protein LOC142775696 isoform X1 [Rhipicephalus microplus]|uniref:uncharacterized protein LOC142775696 isoform X1 n=1 Tax=Rhipicephalus microplus TaxID=6941 RepID=UPI003F6B8AA7